MQPSSQFEILRRGKVLNTSGKFVSAYLAANSGTGAQVNGTVTAVRGLALGAHATDGESVDLAGGNSFIGHLTRRVVVGGLSNFERAIGSVISASPAGLESPFVDGLEVTAEIAQTIEVEGGDYMVLSGTGAITTGAAVGTKLSFSGGKLYVAQSGDTPFYLLSANNLTSTDGSSLRIRAERI
jgi:hypothetical protein